ncbi:hypothetical protein CASFOL_001884 [Castilleja foliolosa]|uniref:Uncharacterized protein n=1 Tax=Castilleja foliolosa TaxID=1961234 RepID=A0ABD3ECZ3_9LAMI
MGDEFSGWALLRRMGFRSPGFVTEGRRSAGVQRFGFGLIGKGKIEYLCN